MPATKKMLVAFDPARSDTQSSDFLVPRNHEGKHVFFGLKSGKTHATGVMVFLGRSISENDLFARLVDSGAVIANVDETLISLRSYLEKLPAFKIGNVVRIVPSDVCVDGFDLFLVAATPSAVKS